MNSNLLFNIKTFTKVSYPDLKKQRYRKLVDGLWYRHTDEQNKANSEIDIVVNFQLSYAVNEDDLQNHQILLKELSTLSGQKSNLSILLARIKEKGKLMKELFSTYKDNLEDSIVEEERNLLQKQLKEARNNYATSNFKYNQTKSDLKEVNELLSLHYKSLRKDKDMEDYQTRLNELKEKQITLSINENQYKIDLDVLKEEIVYLSKSTRKPLTNIEIDKRIQRDERYKYLLSELHDLASILEYVEKLDDSQDEKSLVIRAIQRVVLADYKGEKDTIKFN